MLINDLHEAIRLLNNQGQSRYFAPEKIDKAINDSVRSLIEDLMDEYQRTQRLSDYLLPLEIVRLLPLQGDFAGVPADYAHATGYSVLDNSNNVYKLDFVNSGAWNTRVNSRVVPPEKDYPIMRLNENRFQIAPSGEYSKMELSFIKQPVEGVWGYDVDADGETFVFSQSKSTDLDMPASAFIEILKRAVSYLGVPLREEVLVQFNMSK